MLYQIATRQYHPARGTPAAFIIWSDVVYSSVTKDLLRMIKDNDLGVVPMSPAADNPSTGNQIRVYTWVVHHKNFRKWYTEWRVERAKANL
jgi:hypothetical protein